jgi:hypothetical protein
MKTTHKTHIEPGLSPAESAAIEVESAIALGKADLLRDDLYHIENPNVKDIARGLLLTMILEALSDASIIVLQSSARAIDMLIADRGCITPAEALIDDLLTAHFTQGGITPQFLARQMDPENTDGFAMNFKDQAHVLGRYARTYRGVGQTSTE